MCLRDEPAEVGVALASFGQQSEVMATDDCDLAADDGVDAEVTAGLGKDHRCAEVVVVRDGQCLISDFVRTADQLIYGRGSFLEGIIRMQVELGVHSGKPEIPRVFSGG